MRVIKIGGRAQADPALADALARAAAAEPELVVVHGGGDEISALQASLGGSTAFVDGRRVTTERDIGIVRMALSGSANKRLVAHLVARGVAAVGVSGEDAGLIVARSLDVERLGYVGRPVSVNAALIRHLWAGAFLPVVSPLSRDAAADGGVALNVNGDDAAAALATALGASELLLVSDVQGVSRDGEPVASLAPDDAERLMESGAATGGMRAKLEAALSALAAGVASVRISDLRAIEDRSRGTILRQPEGSS
jgi:acetylglutamate kinase